MQGGPSTCSDKVSHRTPRQPRLSQTQRQLTRCHAAQDKDLAVDIHESAMGFVCTRVQEDSPGHPSTYSTLKTVAGGLFTPTPPGFTGALEGCVTNFAFPSKDSPKGPGICTFVYRHAGSEVAMVVTGSAAWLREKRSKPEIVAAFEATYPNLPQKWLEEMADFMHSKAWAEDLRVRCGHFVLQACYHAWGACVAVATPCVPQAATKRSGRTAPFEDCHLGSRFVLCSRSRMCHVTLCVVFCD